MSTELYVILVIALGGFLFVGVFLAMLFFELKRRPDDAQMPTDG